MKKNVLVIFAFLFSVVVLNAQIVEQVKPIISSKLVFNEENGIAAVEAEHFYKQTKTELRQWYITSKGNVPQVKPNPDDEHIAGASGNAYTEILPDTRVTHADKLIKLEESSTETSKMVNFSDLPGKMAVLYYKVNFNKPGRYYVWVRAFSTGPEDNSVHVGFNDTWPENGQRMQWCDGKNTWRWESKQRTEKEHCGVPKQIFLDIAKAGIHDIQFSMREDGFEMDKFILTKDSNYVPLGEGPGTALLTGKLPPIFEKVEASSIIQPEVVATKDTNSAKITFIEQVAKTNQSNKVWLAVEFPIQGTKFYNDKNWLAINPVENKEAIVTTQFPFDTDNFDMIFFGVGENDGSSKYSVYINDKLVGEYLPPLSDVSFSEGTAYNKLFENIFISNGAKFSVKTEIGSADGKEYSRGRWSGILFTEKGNGAEVMEKSKSIIPQPNAFANPTHGASLISKDGNGKVLITGELKQWHKVTLSLNGPFASEKDKSPNPFSDYRMTVTFKHESGSPESEYQVPAYFATDGNATESGATEGYIWRAHLSPNKKGKWNYKISFLKGNLVATADMPWMKVLDTYNDIEGSFEISASDKSGRDFRSKGRLQYVGKNHLQFAGSGEYFFKAGPDAPETFLSFEDFDNTIGMKPNVPLKKFIPHLQDYKTGDPTWRNGKGKGIIGAINYLSNKGLNSISFLTYNAGGDGDNVWPFVSRNEKMNYDCSKLDQWQLVFDYAQSKGLYLHFKTQETEIDDHLYEVKRIHKIIPEALDAGELGPERRLYYRELIARFGYLLALNWNIGEENTQTSEVQKEIAEYFAKTDPYKNHIVIHSYPQEQDRVYTPLLGNKSMLTGASLQNHWDNTFKKTLKWVNESNAAGRPWVVANDEQGSASYGAVPDNGYKGFDPKETKYDLHDIRKQTLWGNIMAGGAGVEYYFGYNLPENDLLMEDYRSRDKSWDYCRIAISFLKENKIPFQEMKNMDALIGKKDLNKDKHCFAKPGDLYLVYLAYVNTSSLDLTDEKGVFIVEWFNPITGGKLLKGSVSSVKGGGVVELGIAPSTENQDWVVVIRKK